MALIDRLESILPSWALSLSHWLQLGGAMAATIDAFIDVAQQGALAAMPGQDDQRPELGGFPSVDALPLIGRDRGLVRGLQETPGSYASALRGWRSSKRRAGTPFELLRQVRRVIGPNPPRVRTVTSSGIWHSIESDGTLRMHTPAGTGFEIVPGHAPTAITVPAHPWDWDGSTDLFRFWLIIYVPTGTPGLIDGNEGTWNDGQAYWGDGGHIGITTSTALIEQLRALIAEWSPEGVTCPWIILAFDDGSFDPELPGPYPATGMPDGSWGRYGHAVGGTYVRTRLDTARYVRGTT